MNHPTSLPAVASPPDLGGASDESRWFREEVQPHEPKLRAWLRSRFPSLTDIDDLVQEAYLRLFRFRSRGKIENPKGYLFTTAGNAALDHFRRSRVISFVPVGAPGRLSVLEEGPDASAVASRNEELQILREAMHALPTRCRQVFTLRKLYGLSHREIAAKLSISEKTVEEQVNRATRRCAAFLRTRGLP